MDNLIGQHVTLITTMNNQPICLESIVNLFSGVLQDVGSRWIVLKYKEGTVGYFAAQHVIGIIENETVEPGKTPEV